MPLHTVHVRVNDATGKPTPVRLRLLVHDGRTVAPFGRLTNFATGPDIDVGGHLLLGSERFCYVDGTCEVRLPAGIVTVEAAKGPEYASLRREVHLGPGQISLRLAIERWIDLRAEGWYSGDTRAVGLTPHAALLEAAAEDLAVVNLLALERPPHDGASPAFPNLLAFSGTKPALALPGHLVAVNTLNSHPVLGTVALLNCHRVVYPLHFGDPSGADDWSVLDWCEQCHRKPGLVVWPDLPRLTARSPQGEALAAALLGQIDAFEISRFDDPEPAVLGDWYRLLDCGLRLPLAGGSGKDRNTVPLGAVRTYARLLPGEELTYGAWTEAVRAGRTFVTNGPLLTLTASAPGLEYQAGCRGGSLKGWASNDQGPGTVLTPEAGRPVRLRAEARSAVPFDQLELLVNGRVVASKLASGNRQAALLETEWPAGESAWMAARCWGQERLPGTGQCVYAHTSPVYAQVEGKPLRPPAETAAPLLALLDGMLDWTAREARCATEQQRVQLAGVFQAARQELLRR